MEIKQLPAKEVQIADRHAGFIANGFFYAAPGVHLGPYELQALAMHLLDDGAMRSVFVKWELYAKSWVELPHGYWMVIIERMDSSHCPKAGEIVDIHGELYEIRGVEQRYQRNLGLIVHKIDDVVRDEDGHARCSTYEQECRDALAKAECNVT